jgi:hypothetical protein
VAKIKGATMKISIDPAWRNGKILYLTLSIVLILFHYPYPGLAVLALCIQGAFHEFTHALVISLTGGTTKQIHLSKPSYIDFVATSDQNERRIYFAGFAWDLFWTMIAAWFLFMAVSILFTLVAYALLIMAIAFHIFPEHSDFNQWRSKNNV